MTTLDKIKLIDFYLHGVDRGVYGNDNDAFWIIEYTLHTRAYVELNYHTSLDALRPVIVKLNERFKSSYVEQELDMQSAVFNYVFNNSDFAPVFDSVVECIKYLKEKE